MCIFVSYRVGTRYLSPSCFSFHKILPAFPHFCSSSPVHIFQCSFLLFPLLPPHSSLPLILCILFPWSFLVYPRVFHTFHLHVFPLLCGLMSACTLELAP